MKKLLNPIEFFNDKKLLIANIIIFVIGTTVSVLMCANFESPIDLHFDSKIVPLQTILGNTIATISLFIVFFISGKLINKKTRWIDCLNLALYTRILFYFLSLINITSFFSSQTSALETTNDLDSLNKIDLADMIIGYSFVFIFFAFLLLLGITIYRSFTTISNAKKTSDYLILVGIFLFTTIISSFLFRNI